ncbi:Uncharacterised protein [Acinetobacter phage MD-2021a]|nr:Uncharacterised protein [Acinetobacter phage MD-2021a]CAH1068872.1 Uncharacterised protein [Acinetobacter phage MD-2021a]
MKWHPSIPQTIRCAFLSAIVAIFLTAIVIIPLKVLIGPLPEALPLTFYVIFVIVVWFGLLCVDENSEL